MKRVLALALCLMALEMHSQQWVISYPVEEGVVLVGGAGNGDGNYIFGACNDYEDSGYVDAYAMFIDNDGSYIDKRFHFEGYKSHLCSAVCLDDGNAFAVGVKGGMPVNHLYDTLWIAVITPELEIVEEREYPLVEPYITWTTDVYLELDNNGDVIVLADVSRYNYPFMTNGVYVVFKCDTHGNVLKSQYFSEGHGANGARPTGLKRVPDSDNIMILGKGFCATNGHSVCYIDSDLNKIGSYPLPVLENVWNYTDCWKDNGHFLMSSTSHHIGMGDNSIYAAVFEVDEMGHYVDTLLYDRADTADYTAQFGSMAYVAEDVIYVATYWESGDNDLPSDAVICLIDNELNLKGTKRLKIDDTKVRIMHCQTTSEGGCLVYGQCKSAYGVESVCVWKLLPEDFVIPWTLDESPEVLPHQNAYPNPTDDYLNIVLENADSQYVVSVFDICGRKYFEQTVEVGGVLLILDVSNLDKGAYFYEVVVGGHNTQKGKFVKN